MSKNTKTIQNVETAKCKCGEWVDATVHAGSCIINQERICVKCDNVICKNRIEVTFGDWDINNWVNSFYHHTMEPQYLSQSDQMTVAKIAYGSVAAYAAACGDDLVPYAKLTAVQRQQLLAYVQLIMYHIGNGNSGFFFDVDVLHVNGFSMNGPTVIKYIKRVFYSVAAALLSEKMGLFKPRPSVVQAQHAYALGKLPPTS